MVADAFSQILKNGEKNNRIRVSKLEEAIPISRLQYVDDPLLFLDGGNNHLINLMSLFNCFKLVSGMKINWKKSCLAGMNS